MGVNWSFDGNSSAKTKERRREKVKLALHIGN
jgi:hypothetical protein